MSNVHNTLVEPDELPIVRSLRSNVQWTIFGYVAYGACQWLTLIVVARLGRPEMVGQFALSMAVTTPIILLIGLDLRTVQATDQAGRYRFGHFLLLQTISLVVAMVAIMSVTACSDYPPQTALLIFVMGTAKCVEALSDLCHGSFQQHERLDQMAKGRILRGVISVGVMAAGLYFTHSLLLATTGMAVSWIGVLVFFDGPQAARIVKQQGQSISRADFSPARLWQLLGAAVPTGILSCQASLEYSLPRLCIEGYLGDHDLGIYSAISSLIIAATMVANAVFCAVLPRIARHIMQREWDLTWRMLLKLCVIGAGFGSLGIVTVTCCGRWLLELAFGPAYAVHSSLLIVLMVGATIRYATLPFNVGFRAAHFFWRLAILQAISLVATIPVLFVLVHRYGIMGAAYASVVMAVMFAVIQAPAAAWYLRSTPAAE